jgi:adenosylcobinamide-phosphate synthase
MWEVMPVALACLAVVIEALFGYPDRLLRVIGHPVMWIGHSIARLDQLMNRPAMPPAARRAAGAIALVIVIGVSAMIAYGIERALGVLPGGLLWIAIFASPLIAQRSLHAHVARVAAALDHDIAAGRAAVSRIVGRDPDALDQAGVARAAIESLAENFSDGIVAPVFWLAAGGLAGGAAYKAINTADSMIGHRTARHGAFGFAAARLDDVVNLPASRLAALLIVAAAALTSTASALEAWRAVIRDGPHHRSPNAGYPEAAMAGALGLALAGTRVYGGVAVKDALMGRGRRNATADDVRAALALYRRADALLIGLLAALTIFLAVTSR